jgi:hypothetical protein
MKNRARLLGLVVAVAFAAVACVSPPTDTSGSAGGPTGSSSDGAVKRPSRQTTTTTKPASQPAAPVAPPSARPGSFPGDVAAGYVRWGAAVGGNSDPAPRHETVAGVPMGLRRTYFGWDNRMKMVSTAKADLAVGRLPWVSMKTPGWAAMASGTYDAQIDELLRGLGALDGPVWLTVHHEPEGGGGSKGPDDPAGAPAWRAMQQKIRERITATGVQNVAFAPILMSWTFDPRSGRNPADWWVPGVWDFAGIDHYSELEKNTTVEIPMWVNARNFYTSKGLKIAVGEWGNRGTDAQAAAEMRAFYDMAVKSGTSGQAQVIGLAYFDSDLNSPTGGWALQGQPLDEFRRLMKAPTSLRASQTG